jgi:alkane 1-monooxygenase
MTIFLFNVYPTEHVYLHHKYVGTSKDPITCRKNLNLYYYTLRAYFSGHKFVYSYNKAIFLGCISLNAAYLAAIYYTGLISYGDSSLALQKLFFFIQIGLGGFIFLEIIEYIEHYGLIVREDVDKKSINELSSWNADGNMIHNWMIFRFQRHSDHHMNAYKYFTTLELTEKMPKFPITFYEGTFLALIPPLWYYLMDPYVDEQLLNKNVEKSHIKFTNFVRHSVFVVLSCASAYLYYVSVLQPVQAQ